MAGDRDAADARQMLTEITAEVLDWVRYAAETGAHDAPWEAPDPSVFQRRASPPATPAPGPSTAPRAPMFNREPDQAPAPILAPPTGGDPLAVVRADLGHCERCPLCAGRTNIVFGTGSTRARLVVIGEAPGFHEDRTGEPFVGRAGQLLTRMLAAIGVPRQEAYIANVIKCRPPDNRDPLPEEIAACSPFLVRQVEAIQPQVILTVGRFAGQALLESNDSMGRMRGGDHQWQGIPVVPTYHPAYLLRNPADKAKAWQDLQRARQFLI